MPLGKILPVPAVPGYEVGEPLATVPPLGNDAVEFP